MPLEEHNPTLAGLEAALAALAPMPGRIDRDALLFRAGQASVPRRSWLWPGAAAGLALLALTLGVVLAVRPTPAPEVRIVYVPTKDATRPPPSVPEPAPTWSDPEPISSAAVVARGSPLTYLQLEQQVMRWGLEAMPDAQETLSPAEQPLTRERLPGTLREPTSFTNFFDLRSIFQ